MLCNLIERCTDGSLTWRDLYGLANMAYASGGKVWKTFPHNGTHYYAQEKASKDECWQLLTDFAVWYYNHRKPFSHGWHKDELVFMLLDEIWDHPDCDDLVE
jgi:hypothetical protein